nr:MAG TPA: hypothetical protein [Caudoviricetes sp.]
MRHTSFLFIYDNRFFTPCQRLFSCIILHNKLLFCVVYFRVLCQLYYNLLSCTISISNETRKRGYNMKNMKAAETLLERKGFYISNQFDGFTTLPDEYELSDVNGNVVIDHLSEAQILQLSEIL